MRLHDAIREFRSEGKLFQYASREGITYIGPSVEQSIKVTQVTKRS